MICICGRMPWSGVGPSAQGRTVEEAISNLKEATTLYLEEFPDAKKKRAILTTFEVSSVCHIINRYPEPSRSKFYATSLVLWFQEEQRSHVRLSKIIGEEKVGVPSFLDHRRVETRYFSKEYSDSQKLILMIFTGSSDHPDFWFFFCDKGHIYNPPSFP